MTDKPSSRQTPPSNPPEEPATCSYCGEKFVDEQLLALHYGIEHESRLSEAETDAYRAARDAEREDIRLFRLKALAALLFIYFGFIFVYAFVV